MEKQKYTVTAHTENNMGLLSRIAGIFLKRNISMKSFASSIIEADSALRFEIVVEVTEVQVKKITTQIEKQVEVMRAFYQPWEGNETSSSVAEVDFLSKSFKEDPQRGTELF